MNTHLALQDQTDRMNQIEANMRRTHLGQALIKQEMAIATETSEPAQSGHGFPSKQLP